MSRQTRLTLTLFPDTLTWRYFMPKFVFVITPPPYKVLQF